MFKSWDVRPDGSYRPLTETEDLLSEAHSTLEDLVETAAAFREIRSSVREVHQESCSLVEQSQRERRLRTTKLRLVKAPA
jgi:hypothetical protein